MSFLPFQAKSVGKTNDEESGFIMCTRYELLGYFQCFDDAISKIDDPVMIA